MKYPKISIVIPVYNEAEIIESQISHLRNLEYDGKYEILIVDGHKSNTTIKKLSPTKKMLLISSAQGRGLQMNRGAREATGEILLFLHADTFLPESGLIDIAHSFSNCDIAGGCFKLGINSSIILLKIIELFANIRTHLIRIPYGDQAIFVKSDVFEKLDGYEEIPLMEDVELMRSLRRNGYQIHPIDKRVHTSPRRWLDQGIIFCTLRNWLIITLYNFGVSPEKLKEYY